MSDQEPIRGIVVAHGSLAVGLVDAVHRICGADADCLVPLSNMGLSPERLAEAIGQAAGPGPTIVFTDLIGGSCGFVAARLCRELPNLAAIGGVNLPLLLDFVHHRQSPLPELLPRLLQRGRASICCAPTPRWDDHVDRAVQG